MGYLPVSFNLDGEESIWIHAVSVGEALTVRALIADLKRRYPNLRIFLSTTTMAGQQVARRNVQDVDAVFYFPFDLVVRRPAHAAAGQAPAVHDDGDRDLAEPAARSARGMGVATVMVNGRISSRSYPRYKLVRPFFRKVLADVDRFCMQSEESARRLIDIGAEPARVVGDRQPEVRFDRRPGGVDRRRSRAESRAAVFPDDVGPAGHRRRQHDARTKRRSCCRRSGASRRASPTRCW